MGISENLKTKQSYLFFMNSREVNNHKGLVGIGIRELTVTEMSQYCPNSKPSNPPFIPISTTNSSKTLTSNFNYLSLKPLLLF